MVILVCTKKREWDRLGQTRPCFMKNRPNRQVFSSRVSMHLGGWLLHNKNQPVSHGNSPSGSSIKKQKDESCVFGSYIYPFFSVSSLRVSLAVAGGIALLRPDLKSQHAPFPLEIVIGGNQTKTHQNTPTATTFWCQMLRITNVWCGLRQNILSIRLLANDVAFKWSAANDYSNKVFIQMNIMQWLGVGTPVFLFLLVVCFCRHPVFTTRVCWRHWLVLI